jgi:hypothetical protein
MPLHEYYPVLYNIVCHKSDNIATVIATSPPVVTFRRDLIAPRLDAWNALLQHLASIQISSGPMYFCGIYMPMVILYNAILLSDLPVYNNKKVWKMKIPLKTKSFAWYLCRGVILTKDNLVKCNWHVSSSCVFCHER